MRISYKTMAVRETIERTVLSAPLRVYLPLETDRNIKQVSKYRPFYGTRRKWRALREFILDVNN